MVGGKRMDWMENLLIIAGVFWIFSQQWNVRDHWLQKINKKKKI